uniref:Uncharacterized protein n=1 Tax=Arundo donax TaxID=35708 RepID=A0A0A9I1P0_ARUDO
MCLLLYSRLCLIIYWSQKPVPGISSLTVWHS